MARIRVPDETWDRAEVQARESETDARVVLMRALITSDYDSLPKGELLDRQIQAHAKATPAGAHGYMIDEQASDGVWIELLTDRDV